MDELKVEIEQIKIQIGEGIKLGRIEMKWGGLVIKTCNRALTLTDVGSTCCEKTQKHNDLLKDEFKDDYCGWCHKKLA